jgi:hypothetical protein
VPLVVSKGSSGRKLQTFNPYLNRRKNGLYFYRVELTPAVITSSGRIAAQPGAKPADGKPLRLSLAVRLRDQGGSDGAAAPAAANRSSSGNSPLLGSVPYALQFSGGVQVLSREGGLKFVAGPRLLSSANGKRSTLGCPSTYTYHMVSAGRVSVGECIQC